MTETGSSSEVGIHWITLPFGEIPEPIAKWVWQRKWVSLRESIQGNESANAIIWADRPVVLPLHLGDLGKYEELTLEAAVDASLRERLNLKSIGIDSCRAKLRSPGQVILVVYDDESRTLFSLDEPAFKRRTELLRQLHELKRTQSIIFIFSDYHHERLWKSLEPVERTKAIQEAAV